MSENPIVQQQTQPAAIEIHASRRAGGGLIPTTFSEMWRLSRVLVASGMLPKDMKTEAQVFTAMQLGAEIGLSPMVSCQSIAVINGRPTVWGDVALGLVQASGLLADIKEEELYDKEGGFIGFRCTAKRVDRPSPVAHTFTLADAAEAKLIPNHPDSPWTKYRKRMCQMRARGFTLRDLCPDVLKGLILPEEAEAAAPIDVTPAMADRIAETTADRLRARLSAPPLQIDAPTPFDDAKSIVPEASDPGDHPVGASAAVTEAEFPVSTPKTVPGTRSGRKRDSSPPMTASTLEPEPPGAGVTTPQPDAAPEEPMEAGEVESSEPLDLGSILPTEEELPRTNFGRKLMTRFKQISNILRSTSDADPDGRAASMMLELMGKYGATRWREVPPLKGDELISDLDALIRELVDSGP